MLYPRFQKFIKDNHLVKEGDCVVVGVSGGPDSMVLLDLFIRISKKTKLYITAAHVNYGLRGKDSAKDELLVCETAKKNKISFENLRKKPDSKKNLQDSARNIRFKFFSEVALRHNSSIVATAHHMDDQAETVLLHLLRGSGIKGLSGMRLLTQVGRLKIIRPLLSFSKSEIEEYAKKFHVKYREDSTNKTLKYKRNEIRNKLLPLLSKYSPTIKNNLASIADKLAKEDNAISVIAEASFQEVLISSSSEMVVLRRSVYKEFPEAIRVRLLQMAFADIRGNIQDLNSDQLEKMDALLVGPKKSATYRLPASCKFLLTDDCVSIRLEKTNKDRLS